MQATEPRQATDWRRSVPKGIAEAPPGTPQALWIGLLVALVLATGLATWRLRAQHVEAQPLPAVAEMAPPAAAAAPAATFVQAAAREAHARPAAPARPAPHTARPSPPSIPVETLQAVRGRLAVGGPLTPAREVDQWTVRLATSGGHREEMARALERMHHLEPLIREALSRERIPRDLIYLAMIESSYRPGATSRVGAAGVWQFMPGTARSYGLEVSSWVDERRDPVRATFAAARHLSDLHGTFGDWHLAAAAYNAGSGRIERALRRTGKRGGDPMLYWRIRPLLAPETQDYVPKLLAAVRIARNPAGFGFPDLGGDPPLVFREVIVPGGTSLERVAAWAATPLGEVRELNPHLVRGQTPPGRRWPVRVPLVSAR